MPTTVTVKVEGLDDLLVRMRDLNQKMRRKVIRSAALAGANVVKKAIMANAPVKTGDLKASISSRRSRKYSSEAQGYEQRDVGVFKVKGGRYTNNRRNRNLHRVGKAFEVEPPSFYWRMLEFGTVKFLPGVGLGFFRRGFEGSKSAAADAIIAKVKLEIEKTGR